MTDCAAPRHDGDQADTEAHAALCRPCRLGLARDLRRLPALHADLEHIPATRGGDGTGLPFSEPAADCRSQIRHDVTFWTLHVMEVGIGLPRGSWDLLSPIAARCGWLHGQMSWIPFRDWAPDMAGAIGADRARAVALLDPWVTKTFELPGADGVCLECEASEPAWCGECGQSYASEALDSHRQPNGKGGWMCVFPGRYAPDRRGKWCGRMVVTVYVYAADSRKSFIGCTECAARWEFGGAWLPFLKRLKQRRDAA